MSARLRGFTANLTMMKMRVTGWQGICGVRQRPILSSAARCSSDVYGALCWPRCARMMKGKPGFTAGLGSAGDESWKIKGKVQREREARYEKKDSITLAVLACMAVSGGTAYAWNVSGNVSCPNGNIFKNVIINVAGPGCNFTGSGVTDSEGNYLVELPECAGTYTATIDISSLPNGATVTSPTSVDFVITDTDFIATVNFEIGGDACAGVCWFT